jgi:phosphoglycolate phosphatase
MVDSLPSARGLVPEARLRPRLALPAVLLCDLDGTLVDTMGLLTELATDVLEDVFGMPRSLGRELYVATSGLPFREQLGLIAPGDPRHDVAAARFEAGKPARCSAARMRADTRRALADLKERGVKLVVSSNNSADNVAAFAERSDFPFDLVLGHDGVALGKGRPHIDRAARAFGVGPEAMLLVGDSLHDGEIAEREGIRFVGVTGTFSRESFMLRFPGQPIVERLADLADLFD